MFDQHTSAWSLLVSGSSKQQQIPIRILDDEILGAPRLLGSPGTELEFAL